MRRVFALAALLGLVAPVPADAWGFEAHRFIMDRAIALLPTELRPLFERHCGRLVEQSIDPDTWRTAGFDEERKNHFLDLDWEGYGSYPFADLPRDYAAAVAKFGTERIAEYRHAALASRGVLGAPAPRVRDRHGSTGGLRSPPQTG